LDTLLISATTQRPRHNIPTRLAVELTAQPHIEQGFTRYATRRRDVVRRVQDDSDRLARLASLPIPACASCATECYG
jgi:hypothetical protein